MAWFAAIGYAVAGAVTTAAISATVATIVGVVATAVVGAAIGALYSGITGGNILEGAMWGAVGAVAIVAGGSLVSTLGSSSLAGTSFSMSEAAVGSTTTGSSLFSASTTASLITTVGSLGSAFLKGDADQSNSDALIQAQKDMQTEELAAQKELAEAQIAATMAQAEMASADSAAQIASTEAIAAAELEFNEEKFAAEFEESVYRDRADREEAEQAREDSEAGIVAGAAYVAGNTQTIDPVEVNRRRKILEKPSWYTTGSTTANVQSTTPETGLTPGGAATVSTPTPGSGGLLEAA